MCFYFDIHNIMHRLSLWRPIFHSEADFQFSLAWIIKEIYPNCEAARRAGVTPIYRGQPGYSSKLDRDGDGVACE